MDECRPSLCFCLKFKSISQGQEETKIRKNQTEIQVDLLKKKANRETGIKQKHFAELHDKACISMTRRCHAGNRRKFASQCSLYSSFYFNFFTKDCDKTLLKNIWKVLVVYQYWKKNLLFFRISKKQPTNFFDSIETFSHRRNVVLFQSFFSKFLKVLNVLKKRRIAIF